LIVTEVGKTITHSRAEVGRAIDTFTIAAEEAVRVKGEFGSLDMSTRSAGYASLTARFPVGLISMISPYNFPLNLAAHKVAPAIAVGAPFVLKPSERTPATASVLGEILANTKLPEDSWAVLPCHLDAVGAFSEHPDVAMLSFTGSAKVGWALRDKVGRKKVALELGGNAAVIIDKGVDVNVVADRLLMGAFAGNGQSCISVQRVIVHQEVSEALQKVFLEKVAKIKLGDPFQADTYLGPLVSEAEAVRLEKWIQDAVNGGGRLLTGGKRSGAFLEPTVIENAPTTCALEAEEAFGPVCTWRTFQRWDEAIAMANHSKYGLQCGVFTSDFQRAFAAFEQLQVGGVVLNDVPTSRVDSMPYGGVKESGFGREGLRYAMEEMTEIKVLLVKDWIKL